MKIADIISTLLREKGYEVEQTTKGGRSDKKINGWVINDNFYLWVSSEIGHHKAILVYRSGAPKNVSYNGNLCCTDLYHPKSLDIIESWLDNLENLHIYPIGDDDV